MNFFNFPIKRPVTIAMGMLMIAIVGGIALTRMPLDLMPKISFPNLTVMVGYPGAGPEEVEERVGKILEAAIKTTANIKTVKVNNAEEQCLVTAEFNWGTDLDQASADLREKIGMVRTYLPDDIDEPIVIRINMQEMPVMFLHVDDPTGKRNLAELMDIAKDIVAPQLERLPGVANAQAMGGLTREIQVNCDKNKLKQYKMGFTDVLNAIRYQSLDLTTGNIDQTGMRFRIKGSAQFQTVDDIENVIIGYGLSQGDRSEIAFRSIFAYKDNLATGGALSPLRVKDVAEVIDSYKEQKGRVRVIKTNWDPKTGKKLDYLETEGVGMGVMKETDANMVEVADRVKKELGAVQKSLPAGVIIDISFDLSEIITDSIGALGNSAKEGGLLAALIIFLFLWQVRPSLIILTSLPLSLLAAFIGMYFSDFTLNIMTLGGMVIAVGKIVDDSIVVLENIVRHIDDGEDPFTAAEQGFRQVVVAVVAATLVAVIIFLPVAFTSGLSAQLFRSFAATVFFALMASMVISFTVIPMLSSQLLHKEDVAELRAAKGLWGSTKRLLAFIRRGHTRVWAGCEHAYYLMLGWALDNWGKTLLMAVSVMALTGILIFHMYTQGKTEFVPQLVGGMYRGQVKLAPGTLMDETNKIISQSTEMIRKNVPDVKTMFMTVGEMQDQGRSAAQGAESGQNQGMLMVVLYKQADRRLHNLKKSTDTELIALWDEFAAERPNVQISFSPAGNLKFTNEKVLIMKIFGDDFGQLKKISDDLAKEVKKVEGTRDVSTSMEAGVPQYTYHFNRDKLGLYYIPAGLALTEARTALGGDLSTLFREAGKEYDITVRLKKDQRADFKDVADTPLMSPLGFHVPLRDVATFDFDEGPVTIKRENSKRMVTVEANKTEKASLGKIQQQVQAIVDAYPLPEGYLIDFGGEAKDQKEAFSDLGMMFIASIVLVYLILASLYESLIHPLTILTAVPLSFTGAIGALYLTDTNFGVTAFIGLIMLVGIVANNSIVLIDFVLHYHRELNMERRSAILEAGKTRLRPILMTALTAMFGVVPIALGRAEGMELQQPLGIVMVGGLISSTMLTLLITPVIYMLFDDLSQDLQKFFGRKKLPAGPTPATLPGAGPQP
jgi:hydrophobic/amphiphilic exporter-1 (mainly G- bacteria), HAE1 family